MRKFTKNNEEFICFNCNKKVLMHPTSSRDHCNHCLFSLHVDINPGDRLNECKGVLEPVGIEIKSKKLRIVYRCRKCKERVFCVKAPDDKSEEIMLISKKIWN